MPTPAFVHLRLHSEFSVTDGIVRIDDAVAAAVADAMPALALTDLGNVFGLVKFYGAARAKGIKPVAGCDVWVSNPDDSDRPARLLLLVQNGEGWLRLCQLLSRAYRENMRQGRAALVAEWFDDSTAGLIALSGAHLGEVGQALAAGNRGRAKTVAATWAARFPERYYLEIQRAGQPDAEACLAPTLDIADALGLPVVATHPVQFMAREDFNAHEARVCIAEGALLSDRRRARKFTAEQYFKTAAEMQALFADVPGALENTVEIARRCNLSLELGKSKLPRFPTPHGEPLEVHLRAEAGAGLDRRLAALYPDPEERARQAPRYRERLDFELVTIIQMGFPGYFLIVADFIGWAKNNGVPVGPGRGSGAGSLVAYSLGITDLDPLKYDLLFERFLNPERVSMPDFDVDFCQDGRDRVIDYVRKKYGEDSVSQIATFGTMAAKAVVRDVGRVLDKPYTFCDQLAKLIPFQPGKTITLQMAREMEPQLKEREAAEEDVRELLVLAEKLEGLARNVGMHAGGVLIAPGKITDFCPVYCAEGSNGVVSQFDKDDVEKVGLVKFDFLGLRTLTIIDWASRYIRALDPARRADFRVEDLALDDADTYALFRSANTTAIFQFESRGMRDLLTRARPDRFEDIIALVALYRPGPMDLIPDFIRRKHGLERVEYMDPRLVPILSPTYGIMVYQEQVMQIAQVIGGYSLGSADLLRRAMGKKMVEEMATHRSIFAQGAMERGLDAARAEHLFDLMEKFAGYGFNKSHAAAYALVAYHTAWLKAHHPAAFMAATLSSDMDDTDKVKVFIEDAKQIGLVVLAPDMNASDYRFVPVDAHTLRYGLGAIKGTGESAIAAILKAREEGGPFLSLFDLCARVDKRAVNRRVIESLIRGGALDSLTLQRASLLASVGMAMEAAGRALASVHQDSLFETPAESAGVLAEVPLWSEREQLQQEKSALGFYFSGHPFTAVEAELSGLVRTRLDALNPQPAPVLLAGIVTALRTQMTRRGKMAFVSLDDGRGQVEVAVFKEQFEAHRSLLKEDELLIVEGRVSQDDYSGGLRVTAERLMDLDAARGTYARALELTMNGASRADRLHALLAPYRGGTCPVTVIYRRGDAACRVRLGAAWKVRPDAGLLTAMREWLAADRVQVKYG